MVCQELWGLPGPGARSSQMGTGRGCCLDRTWGPARSDETGVEAETGRKCTGPVRGLERAERGVSRADRAPDTEHAWKPAIRNVGDGIWTNRNASKAWFPEANGRWASRQGPEGLAGTCGAVADALRGEGGQLWDTKREEMSRRDLG